MIYGTYLDYIKDMLERAEDRKDLDSFNYWYAELCKWKREHEQ